MVATLIAFLLAVSPNTPPQFAPAPATPMELGVNVTEVDDYTAAVWFADLFKHARYWASPASPANEAGACSVGFPNCVDANASRSNVDANGWPTGDFSVVLMAVPLSPANDQPWVDIGNYAFQATGYVAQANFTVAVGVGASISGWAYNAGTNTTTATVTIASNSDNNLTLSFINTKRTGGPTGTNNTGLTNLSLMRPGHVLGVDTFNKAVLKALAPFTTLRFMDFHNTNNCTSVNWTDRKLTTEPSQSGTAQKNPTRLNTCGAAYEYAIQLANTLNKNVWFTVPARSTSAYWTSLAQLISGSLNSNLKVYVEWSNEVWNFSFQQNTDNRGAAEAESQNPPVLWAPSTAYTSNNGTGPNVVKNGANWYICATSGTSAASGGPTGTGQTINDGTVVWQYVNGVVAGAQTLALPGEDTSTLNGTTNNMQIWSDRRLARQAKLLSDAFVGVFGAAAVGTRLFPLYITQIDGTSIPNGLNWISSTYGAPSKFFWGGGGAPYFNLTADLAGNTIDNLLGNTSTNTPSQLNWDMDQTFAMAQRTAAGFKSYGLQVVNYEGGPTLTGTTAQLAKAAANRDPRMGTAMLRNWALQQSIGTVLHMHFDFGTSYSYPAGYWGLYENVRIENPKSQAAIQWALLYGGGATGRLRFPSLTVQATGTGLQGCNLPCVVNGISLSASANGLLFFGVPQTGAGTGPSVKYFFQSPGVGYLKLVLAVQGGATASPQAIRAVVNSTTTFFLDYPALPGGAFSSNTAAVYIPVVAGTNTLEIGQSGQQVTAGATGSGGTLTVAANSPVTGYHTITRTVGSWAAEGYTAGMQTTTTGFTNAGNNALLTVVGVTASTLSYTSAGTPVNETAPNGASVPGASSPALQLASFTLSDQ